MIKTINIQEWNRRRQYEFFKNYAQPHFNLTTNLDISAAYDYTKKHKISLFKTILYVTMKVANHIPEFRYRIIGDDVFEHDIVHPSFTVSLDNEQFSFCNSDYHENISQFFKITADAMEQVRKNPFIQTNPDRENRIYISCIPWIAFTSIMHPLQSHPSDSVPRIAWGKYIHENTDVKLPYSVQAHHALVDGFHAGKFLNMFQKIIAQPEQLLSALC